MTGFIMLGVVTILAIFCVRWVARKLRLPTPAAYGIAVVFILVVLTFWAEHFKK